jgi:hypothetical protein
VAGALALAVAAALLAEDVPRLTAYTGLAGAVALAVGLVLQRGALATLGLALLGGGYAFSLAGKGVDPAAALFAGGLVLVAELAYWALEPGAAVRLGRGATARRLLVSLALALAAVLLAALLLAVSGAPGDQGVALAVAGVAAIGGIIVVAIGLALTLRPRPPVG